jgi:hypothetical protein
LSDANTQLAPLFGVVALPSYAYNKMTYLAFHYPLRKKEGHAKLIDAGKGAFLYMQTILTSNCYTAEPSLQSFSPVTKKMIQRSIKVPFLVGLNSSTKFAENFTFWNRRVPISYAIRVSKAKDQLGIPCVILNHAEPHLSVKIFGAKVFSAGIHLPS